MFNTTSIRCPTHRKAPQSATVVAILALRISHLSLFFKHLGIHIRLPLLLAVSLAIIVLIVFSTGSSTATSNLDQNFESLSSSKQDSVWLMHYNIQGGMRDKINKLQIFLEKSRVKIVCLNEHCCIMIIYFCLIKFQILI